MLADPPATRKYGFTVMIKAVAGGGGPRHEAGGGRGDAAAVPDCPAAARDPRAKGASATPGVILDARDFRSPTYRDFKVLGDQHTAMRIHRASVIVGAKRRGARNHQKA